MDTLLPVILVVLILGFVVMFIALTRQIRDLRAGQQDDRSAQLLNQNIQGMQQRLDETTKSVNERLDRAASYIATSMSAVTKTMSDVGKELGGVQEIGQNLKRFQEVLNAPKLRGNLGEHILAESLAQVFPREHYTLQHKFRGGETVDAIVRTEGGFIPIDSKFPFEQWRRSQEAEDPQEAKTAMREFTRSVKKHIDDVRKKYILTEEGTVDFAVMYVPSEALFYDVVLASAELMEFARERKVLLVSPNSFFHFLRAVFMGLERGKVAQEAMKVWELLKGVQQEFGKFGESVSLVSRHVTNAKNAIDSVSTEYSRLAVRMERVEMLKPSANVEVLEEEIDS
ncbi:MAG: DNA recombination protein RmuC [Candidatus Uhrbacteria bacterium]